jgi:hypothetical protein
MVMSMRSNIKGTPEKTSAAGATDKDNFPSDT